MNLLFPFLVLSLGYVFATQKLVSWLVGLMTNSILQAAERMHERKDLDKETIDAVDEELVSLRAVKIKKESLQYLTKVIGWIEVALFAGVVFVLMSKGSMFNIANTLAAFFAGWVAIKVVGNYGQWSGSIFGRASFYSFLIGTLLNVLFAIMLGAALFQVSKL